MENLFVNYKSQGELRERLEGPNLSTINLNGRKGLA